MKIKIGMYVVHHSKYIRRLFYTHTQVKKMRLLKYSFIQQGDINDIELNKADTIPVLTEFLFPLVIGTTTTTKISQ